MKHIIQENVHGRTSPRHIAVKVDVVEDENAKLSSWLTIFADGQPIINSIPASQFADALDAEIEETGVAQ